METAQRKGRCARAALGERCENVAPALSRRKAGQPAPRLGQGARNGTSRKTLQLVQGLDAMWKWSVPALVGQTKSGKKESHAAGVEAAQRAIDKSLAPKKQRL
jgi:hypothetical protein